jgi:hypothetical protein
MGELVELAQRSGKLEISDTVRLLVGIEHEGELFRTVRLDEMTGYDEELLANPKFKAVPARGITAMLRRVVQEIPGVMPAKKDPMKLAPVDLFRRMYQADRDMLLVACRLLSFGAEMTVRWQCPSCKEQNEDDVDLTELEVREWPDGEEPTMDFVLPKGIFLDGKMRIKGTMRLPTGKDSEPLSQLARTDPGGATSAMLAALIVDLDGVKPDRMQMQRMRSSDRQFLGELFQRQLPGVRLEADLVCPACYAMNPGQSLDMSGFFSPTSTQ